MVKFNNLYAIFCVEDKKMEVECFAQDHIAI